MRIQLKHFSLSLLLLFSLSNWSSSFAQRGIPAGRTAGFTLFGDVEISGVENSEVKNVTFDLLLYSRSGVLIDRQRVGSKGRYRFLNVPGGDYDLVFEFENTEVARTPIRLIGNPTDVRQDVAMEWRRGPGKPAKSGVISADDVYERKSTNANRFEKARVAIDKKEYDVALALLQEIVADDPQDFQSLAELGTVYLAKKDLKEAEAAYLRATEVRPTFFRAFLNLGRVRSMQKNYESAITALEQAVTLQPKSAEANYFLGEAYLQVKKGSKAVGYLNEAIKLDPVGMADIHLRLATLYNAAGLKDKAAREYEEFLKKKPDYPERKKLEQYISENKSKP